MRILQVCPRYRPCVGGIEEHVRNLSERLSKTNEITVATTDPVGTLPKEAIINDVHVLRFRSLAPKDAYYISLPLKKYLKANSANFDIIHAHSYHAFPALYVAEVTTARNFVFTPHYHGSGHTLFRKLLHFPYKMLGKHIFERARKVICVSKSEKNLIVSDFKIPQEKTVIIPNGINSSEFAHMDKDEKDHKIILCVGRLEKYKGIQYLIKALPFLDSDIMLEIVGVGPYEFKLTSLAKSLGVRSRVTFFSNLSRASLLQKFANAGLFALLSEHESYGLCVAEALAMKTPCIVANTSALKEWIDNENCFGVNIPINLAELVSMVEKVLGKNIIGIKSWDWNNAVTALNQVYMDL
jgi:glycosyltransferase involved in cell wall biosynthesis